MVTGLAAVLAGIVLLLLAYFKSFLSVLVVIAALAAIAYGVIALGLVQKAVGFFKGLGKK